MSEDGIMVVQDKMKAIYDWLMLLGVYKDVMDSS